MGGPARTREAVRHFVMARQPVRTTDCRAASIGSKPYSCRIRLLEGMNDQTGPALYTFASTRVFLRPATTGKTGIAQTEEEKADRIVRAGLKRLGWNEADLELRRQRDLQG